MKELIRQELKKIYSSAITRFSLLLTSAFALFLFLYGNTWDGYCANEGPLTPSGRQFIQRAKANMTYASGEVTDEWAKHYFEEEEKLVDDLVSDPANLIPEDERSRIMAENPDTDPRFFLIPEIHIQYLSRYESIHFAAGTEERAEQVRTYMLEKAAQKYTGNSLAKSQSKISRMFDAYQNQTLLYGYNYGWHRMRNVHYFFPFTLAIALLAGLAPLFASENTLKTDSLIYSRKHGRTKDIIAKLAAGLIYTLLTWLVYEIMSIIIICFCYGFEGAETMWQDWVIFKAPFCFNNAQITAAVTGTSLLGTVFTAMIIILISSLSKSSYASIILGAVCLFGIDFFFGAAESSISMLNIMKGYPLWQSVNVYVIFGAAVTGQSIAIVSIILLCILLPLITYQVIRHTEA